MAISPIEQSRNAKEFVRRWKEDKQGNEEQDSRTFWIQFQQELLGVDDATRNLEFERKVKGRKIDVFDEDMGVLVEMKSRGVSLDEATVRSKKAGPETPYQQAKWYADNLPNSYRPNWIITSNFDEIRIYNLDTEDPEKEMVSVTLDELPSQLPLFRFMTDRSSSRLVKEKELSVEAGAIVGRLYKSLSAQYMNIETDANEQRSLNILITRFVFLLYAEDAGILNEIDQFYHYLHHVSPEDMRSALLQLFEVLDTPEDKRDPYLPEKLAAFPYINGGLFAKENIVIPQFTEQIKNELLREASQDFNWSDISPTIFGAAFESTLNPETRREGGMHYTSIENIHKVIDPLFLDDLKQKLTKIEGEKTQSKREMMLRRFQMELASIKILDPACGSGNFLTESYLSLRKLENRVLENLQGDQMGIGYLDDESVNPIRVSIDQFYGIEINDFAVSVAKTALWIAEEQMMKVTSEIFLLPMDFLPLTSNDNIHEGNALRMDWNEVLPAQECNYVIGNPPFVGAKVMSRQQKQEVVDLFGKIKLSNSIDYVTAWYVKTAQMMQSNSSIHAAFVSTSSISQGQQVMPVWSTLLYKYQLEIDFAYTTFIWNNEATDQAHVHVVIIGFSRIDSRKQHKKTLFTRNARTEVANINPYLSNAPNVIVDAVATPLSRDAKECDYGSLINDGGNYIFKPDELKAFLEIEPRASSLVRPIIGSDELIKGKERYVLYLRDVSRADLEEMPEVKKRVEAVRNHRAKSSAAATRKSADTPTQFYFDSTTNKDYLVLPSVSSERRYYVPIDFRSSDYVATNLVSIIPGATFYDFGILTSHFHNAWMRAVAGRLESRYRYSPKTVYNTFIWPDPTPEQRQAIEDAAQFILDVRAEYPDKSLAELYDPDKMPDDLRQAHKDLDRAVEAAYGVDFDGDEEKIVAHLFKLYAEATKEQE